MSAESLKEKMQDFKDGKIGSVKVTGKDLAAAASGETKPVGPTKGTVKADVPQEAKDDAFTIADATAQLHQGLLPSFLMEQVEITEEDRNAFIEALVSGSRYERPFELFGGKIKGVFRCRSIPESDGILAYLSRLINEKQIDAKIEYMTLMRNAILSAQVKSIRGLISEDFEELAKPYGPTRRVVERKGEDGGTVRETVVDEPGWIAMAKSWNERPEALVTALHNELQLFDRRYWAMVNEARNTNFWNPAASI